MGKGKGGPTTYLKSFLPSLFGSRFGFLILAKGGIHSAPADTGGSLVLPPEAHLDQNNMMNFIIKNATFDLTSKGLYARISNDTNGPVH